MSPRYYSGEHLWVQFGVQGSAIIGVTDHAQKELGDILYVALPAPGTSLQVGAVFGVIESVKTASDLYAPVTGKVVECNDRLKDEPWLVNDSPEDAGWIAKLECESVTVPEGLMDEASYRGQL